MTFDSVKAQLADSNGKLTPGKNILGGMIAGAVESVTVVTPTERIKTALYVPNSPSTIQILTGFAELMMRDQVTNA